jgi:lipopolysaccharide transport system permease protein
VLAVAVQTERASVAADTTTVVRHSNGWARLELRELWRYRELLYCLTWKSILIQYRQALLGIAWAVLNPVLTMIVFTAIFNRILHVGTGACDAIWLPSLTLLALLTAMGVSRWLSALYVF